MPLELLIDNVGRKAYLVDDTTGEVKYVWDVPYNYPFPKQPLRRVVNTELIKGVNSKIRLKQILTSTGEGLKLQGPIDLNTCISLDQYKKFSILCRKVVAKNYLYTTLEELSEWWGVKNDGVYKTLREFSRYGIINIINRNKEGIVLSINPFYAYRGWISPKNRLRESRLYIENNINKKVDKG
jgi:hypothetical protein